MTDKIIEVKGMECLIARRYSAPLVTWNTISVNSARHGENFWKRSASKFLTKHPRIPDPRAFFCKRA